MPVNKPWLLYAYFTAYYFAQGTFQAYGAFEQPYLESYGVDLEHVAFAQSVAQIPWIIKIVFAIPSDMFNCWGWGFRRPYAFVGLSVGAIFLAVLSSSNPGGNGFGSYVFVALLRNLGVCISDVATDGFAVDSGLEEQSGLINAFMTAGRMMGLIIGSRIAGSVAQASGYGPMITALAIMVACVIWLPLILKEERQVGKHDFHWDAFKQFKERTVLLFLFSTCCSNMGLAIAAFPMAKWQRTRFGFSLDDVGTGSAVASAGLLVGSIANGYLFDRVGKRLAMLVAGTASSATLLAFLLAFNKESALAARFFAGAAEGALWIVQAGLTMRLADKRSGASFFALAIMAMNFAIMIGNAVAGPIAERISLEACFVTAGIISFVQLAPLPWLAHLDGGGSFGGSSGGQKGVVVDVASGAAAHKGTGSPKGPFTTVDSPLAGATSTPLGDIDDGRIDTFHRLPLETAPAGMHGGVIATEHIARSLLAAAAGGTVDDRGLHSGVDTRPLHAHEGTAAATTTGGHAATAAATGSMGGVADATGGPHDGRSNRVALASRAGSSAGDGQGQAAAGAADIMQCPADRSETDGGGGSANDVEAGTAPGPVAAAPAAAPTQVQLHM